MLRRCTFAVALVVACKGDEAASDGDTTTGSSSSDSSTSSGAVDTTGTADTTSGEEPPFEWPQESLVEHVDPFIGSGGIGYQVGTINPGASVPFGMVKPGPDTGIGGLQISFLNCTGYHYDQTHVWGFTHSRINGMGVPDYGALLVVPTVGVDAAKIEIGGARSLFDHEHEEASPGYYAVDLLDPGVHVELTATMAVALHRYTWDVATPDAAIVLDLGYNPGGGRSPASTVEIDEDAATIRGMTTVLGGYSSRFGGVPTYFVARFSRPFATSGVWDDAKAMSAGPTMDGAEIGAWAGFELADDARTVEVAVAISYVSIEQAEANLAAEAPEFDFDGVRAAAVAAWDDELHRVRVLGGSADDRTKLYTAVYHAFLAPTTFSEQGGVYRGFDGAVHEADGFTYHSDFSLWDTYRTLHPLLNLVQRDRSGDMMQSLVRMYEQGGSGTRAAWSARARTSCSPMRRCSRSRASTWTRRTLVRWSTRPRCDRTTDDPTWRVGWSAAGSRAAWGWHPRRTRSSSPSRTTRSATGPRCSGTTTTRKCSSSAVATIATCGTRTPASSSAASPTARSTPPTSIPRCGWISMPRARRTTTCGGCRTTRPGSPS